MKKLKFFKIICLMLSLSAIFSMSVFAVDETSIPIVFESVEEERINHTYTVEFVNTTSWKDVTPTIVPLLNETIQISWAKSSGSGVSSVSFRVYVAGQDRQDFNNVSAGTIVEASVKSLKEYYVMVKSDSGIGKIEVTVKTK